MGRITRAAQGFVLLTLFVCTMPLAAQTGGAPRIPSSVLLNDFAILRRAYEELHPGLYRYNTKAQMDAHFAALRDELSRDLTLAEAYIAFSRFTAQVKCGHTYPNFFNQPKSIAAALFQHQDRVPFYFRWIGRRMIITRNFSSDRRLVPGTEVLSINGIPAATILDRLLTVSRADGSNDAKRVNNLEVQGLGDYEAFDIYFPLFFPPESPRLELRIRGPRPAGPRTIRVDALTYEQRRAPIQAEEAARHGGDTPLWELRFLDAKNASLRMPTWALYDSKWDWKGFLDQSFQEIARRQIANLVIDLRGNEGGLSVGDVLLSKLIREDLPLASFQRRVRYRKVPDDLVPYLDTWDPSFKDWRDAATDPHDGFYTLKKYDDDARGTVIHPSGPTFTGHVYVLVNAANSSATFELAQAVQQHKLGTLVGQPTGGNQRGINGGAFFFLRLPNSKIEIDLPLIGYFPPTDRPDAGLTPDLPVEPSVEDIAKGVDPELRAVQRAYAGSSRAESRFGAVIR